MNTAKTSKCFNKPVVIEGCSHLCKQLIASFNVSLEQIFSLVLYWMCHSDALVRFEGACTSYIHSKNVIVDF